MAIVPDTPERLPHSRVGIASFAVSLVSVVTSGHLMPLLATAVHLPHRYLLGCLWTAAVLAGAGVLLAMGALFDRNKNRIFGMLGWWVGVVAQSTLALAIRLAVRHHLMRF